MSKKKQVSIKLEVTGENTFGREAWYGFGPFSAELGDDSLTLNIPQMDQQILTPAVNDYGTYYVFDIGGGKGFASVIDHEKYGKYLRLRLGDKVELPASVVEKMNYKPKAAGKVASAGGGEAGGFWK